MSFAIEIDQARPREEAPQPLTRQPLFVRFWIGQSISVFGDQISALAIPLTAILALHASALEVGILTAMAWLPHLLFSLPAGVWIDRRAHRRRNMIVVDILRATALATIPVAWWLGALTMWQLVAVAFAVGALTVFFDLSGASFFVALVHRSQYVDATSKLSTTRSLSYIAGPSTAGFLVQALTAPVAIAADSLSFVVSAIALRGVRVREPEVKLNGSSARADLKDGFRYLAHQPVLRAGVACTSTINFFSFFIFAIFVLYASQTLGLSAGAIGLILGAASFGALAGALIAPRVGRRLGIGRAVVVGSVLFPAPMALFPLAHGPHWLSGAMLLAGEFLASVGVMIFVLYASQTLGLSAGAIGLILGAASFGALAGALIAPRVGRRLGIGRAVVVGSVLFPAPMALFPLAHGPHWLSGAMLLAGEFLASVGVMIFDVNQNSLMLMLIPQAVRSRVVGVSRFFNYGTRPFGALLGGALGATIGLRPTLWVAVAGCLIGVLFLLVSPMPHMREEDLA